MKGPYMPCLYYRELAVKYVDTLRTEINRILSILTVGLISTRSSEAMNSSSGGVIVDRSAAGSDIGNQRLCVFVGVDDGVVIG